MTMEPILRVDPQSLIDRKVSCKSLLDRKIGLGRLRHLK
jgi:hypothetical protein